MAITVKQHSFKREIPNWVCQDVRLYLDHIEGGVPIRALARDKGVHASTVLRKVRKTESRRDDPLVDNVLLNLGRLRRVQGKTPVNPDEVLLDMSDAPPDEITLKRDAIRILRALMQPGAVLAVMADVQTAVVVCESPDGRPRQMASVERPVAEAMALQNWITCTPQGRVSRYYINQKGRVALNKFLAEKESEKATFNDVSTHRKGAGLSGANTKGANLHVVAGGGGKHRTIGAESPLQVLARRRDKSGATYLSHDLLMVGERLRMDFEVAQMDGQGIPSWEAIMQASAASKSAKTKDPRQYQARLRLENAMRFLGPELGDIALITCCHEQGMEHTEKTLHMPARSGKYVLRIALNMLARHFENDGDEAHNMIS